MTENTPKKATVVLDAENGWTAVEVRSQRDADAITAKDGLIFDTWAEADTFVTDGLPAIVGHPSKTLRVTGRPVFVKGAELARERKPRRTREQILAEGAIALGTVKALREAAKGCGIKGAAKLNKAALIDALRPFTSEAVDTAA